MTYDPDRLLHLPNVVSFFDPDIEGSRKTVSTGPDIINDTIPEAYHVNIQGINRLFINFVVNQVDYSQFLFELFFDVRAAAWGESDERLYSDKFSWDRFGRDHTLEYELPVLSRYILLRFLSTDTDGDQRATALRFDLHNQSRVSHDLLMLTKIKRLLEGRPDDDIAAYEINGRKIERMRPAELMKWLEFYERRWQQDQDQVKLQDSGKNPRIIVPRFRR